MNKTLTAYAPASIGNVSLGFDLLGAALKPVDGSLLGDQVEVTQVTEAGASEFSLEVTGAFANKLPPEPQSNIVYHCYTLFMQKLAELDIAPSGAIKMVLHKNLPIGSGLGSSASSIVAALYGLNAFYNDPFDKNTLLLMMGELEGQISGSVHYDNVAPCYLGGLTLMNNQADRIALSLPTFENWYWVVCYSGISVSTSAARNILPKTVSMADTIDFGRQLAVFVDASYRKDQALAASVMKDVLAEPHRKSLLPKFDESRAFSMEQGALAFGISGSGPTVFAVCDDLNKAESIHGWLNDNYIQNELGFSHICQLDLDGTVCL